MSDTAEVKTLIIDEKEVSGRRGQTILEVARENDIDIPTLCHLDGLHDVGACRMCLVEIKGSNKLLPACVATIFEGMEVFTNTERLQKYRHNILELLFAERNHICAVCVSNGHCELQSMATRLGVSHVRYPYSYPVLPVDVSHAKFVLDHNRCILCTRCVRVCAELEGANVWEVASRGIYSRIVSDLKDNWGQAKNCTACGKCVQVCPTGALSEKGKSAGEMQKRRAFVPYLNLMREELQ